MGLAYLLDPSFQIVDKSGNPVSNGYIEVYISGTSTKYYCYSDFNGSLHPFRIPLDALGSNIILANSESIYDVFVYNSFGTLVMSRHRVEPITSITTSGYAYIFVEGTEGQIAVQSSGSTDITYKVGLDDAIISELSGIHNDISSTSSYLDDKINNLDIITIAQSGAGNAFSTFTRIGDTYVFKKENTFLPSANAPVVIAGDNVEVSSSNVNGQMQYTVKANPAGNVTNVISTDNSISISATSAGNDVTYDLSINDIAGANNYAFLKSEMPVNATEMALEYTNISTSGIHWNTIDQRLEFGDNIKLVDLNFNIEYEIDTANGVAYDDLILYIYSDGQLLDQETFTIDTSIAKHTCKFNKKILDPSNLQFLVKVPKAGDITANIDVNDETFKSIGTGGGGGTTYSAGPNINISDNVISGRDWTPELNAKLDITSYTLPNSANWDNTYNTVLSNSADWNEVSGKQDILFLGDTLSGLGTSASPLQAKPVQIVSNNHSITVSSNVLSGTSIFNIEAVNSTIVEASASTIGEVATVSIEQGDLYIVDLSEETTITDIEIVLTNNASVEFPFWWFKIESGSDATLSIKIGAVEVGWLGYAITNIELGKTIEVSVVDNVACGGELV